MHSELLPSSCCFGPKMISEAISEHLNSNLFCEEADPELLHLTHTSNLTTSNKCHGYCPEVNSCCPSLLLHLFELITQIEKNSCSGS